MKKALATLAILALAATAAHAQTILAWDFTGATGSQATSTATVFNAGLDSTNLLSRGSAATGSAGGNGFRTLGFQNDGIAVTNNDYFQFSLSATAGNTLSLSTIDAIFAGTAGYSVSPGVSMAFSYSFDGGTTQTLLPTFVRIGNGAMTQIDLTGVAALQNMAESTTVTFRMYASGQTSTGGWGYNSPSAGSLGLAIGGAVVPEPSTIALLALGIVAGAVSLRRKLS